MSEKKKTKKGTKPAKNTDTICQNCRFHKNRPSTCHVYKDEPTPTGRKGYCDFFLVRRS